MAEERTVTKIVFYDSSDDEEENHRRGACLAGSASAVKVDLPAMNMSEEDMIDPDAHLNSAPAGSDDDEGGFVEDTVASARAARGEDNASRIQVAGMPIGGTYDQDVIEEKAARDPQFRRVAQVEEALSTLKRFREEGDDEPAGIEGGSAFMRAMCPDGVPHPVLLPGGRRIENDDPVTDPSQVGWGDGVAERVEGNPYATDCAHPPRRQYPRSVPMATHIVKVTPEGYQLTLDEADVQDLLDEEDEEDSDDDEMDDLITISAIEQLAAACRRYNPDEEGGGMCGGGNELDAEDDVDDNDAPTAQPTAEVPSEAAASSSSPIAAVVDTNVVVDGTAVVEGEVAGGVEEDGDDDDAPTDKMCKKFRPRSFDEFANKADEWLRRLRDGEVAIAAVTDALEDDIWRVMGALKRLNAPKAAPIVIDGVKMDF